MIGIHGRLEVITGCMFAGKSGLLVRELHRASRTGKRTRAFKHASDDRYRATGIVTHDGETFDAHPVSDVTALEKIIAPDSDIWAVVGIDEAQFFDVGLVALCEKLVSRGVRVLVAGLDMDSDGKPFGSMPHLLARAETVTKLSAVCTVCRDPATRSFHKTGKSEQIEIGADKYEARCRSCWAKGPRGF